MKIKKEFDYNNVLPIDELLEAHFIDKKDKKKYYIDKTKEKLNSLTLAIEYDKIDNANELFEYVPKNLFTKMLGYTYQSHFSVKIKKPLTFRLEEIRLLARYLKVSETAMYRIFAEYKEPDVKE